MSLLDIADVFLLKINVYPKENITEKSYLCTDNI